jgi:hypothetical protein
MLSTTDFDRQLFLYKTEGMKMIPDQLANPFQSFQFYS